MTKQQLHAALGLTLMLAPLSLIGCGETTPAPATPAPTVESGKADPGPPTAGPKADAKTKD